MLLPSGEFDSKPNLPPLARSLSPLMGCCASRRAQPAAATDVSSPGASSDAHEPAAMSADASDAFELGNVLDASSPLAQHDAPTLRFWGSSLDGQLGIGPVESGIVGDPRGRSGDASVDKLDVALVTFGARHSIMVTHDGDVYAAGANEHGQLGLGDRLPRSRHLRIVALEPFRVCAASCGDTHSAVVSTDGELFVWGSNTHGELGRGDHEPLDDATRPRRVALLRGHCIVKVTCGASTTYALTSTGMVFAFGLNDAHQLALGRASHQGRERAPVLVEPLATIPIVDVVVGARHSLFLSARGTVYAAGNNSHGQLGIGSTVSQASPILVRAFESLHPIRQCAAGINHSVFLTQSGRVFTCGAGGHGQLGHTTRVNQDTPRMVCEFMGTVMVQVAAGRRHTLVLTESGRVLGCGLSSLAQLATTPDNTATIHATPITCSNLQNVVRFYAGGDSACALVAPTDRAGDYHLPAPVCRNELARLDSASLVDNLESQALPSAVASHIHTVFSSLSALNMSFCSSTPSSVDWNAAVVLFARLFSSSQPSVVAIATEALKNLFGVANDEDARAAGKRKRVRLSSSSSTPGTPFLITSSHLLQVESALPALPLLLLLPFISTAEHHSLLCAIIKIVAELPPHISEALNALLRSLPLPIFSRILTTLQANLTRLLGTTTRVSAALNGPPVSLEIQAVVQLLTRLAQCNTQRDKGEAAPLSHFYNDMLCAKINLEGDYSVWREGVSVNPFVPIDSTPLSTALLYSNDPTSITTASSSSTTTKTAPLLNNTSVTASASAREVFTFCSHATALFDVSTKQKLLAVDSRTQMAEQACLAYLQAFLTPQQQQVGAALTLRVRRDHLVDDVVRELMAHSAGDLKKAVNVQFVGEEGDDAGGLRKELFTLVVEQLLDPAQGMFTTNDESGYVWFQRGPLADDNMYQVVGIICGLAIYNLVIIDLPFAPVLFKRLIGSGGSGVPPPTLADLRAVEPTIARSLQQLLDDDSDTIAETYGLTFAVSIQCANGGGVEEHELVPHGAEVAVTQQNKHDFVRRYVELLLVDTVASRYRAFARGFLRVCGGPVLALFHPSELEQLMIGARDYDFAAFEAVTQYHNGYSRDCPTIRLFWRVFHSFSDTDKHQFLKFATGSDRVAIGGFSRSSFAIQQTHDTSRLPVAHTCFNLLDLPPYPDESTMRSRLLLAIRETQGFGLV